MTPIQPHKLALVFSAALLCACSPPEKDAQLEALKEWSPQVPPLEAPVVVPAAGALGPVKTFADRPPENKAAALKPSEPPTGLAKSTPTISARIPSAVQVKEFRPKELPQADTCEALPLLQKLPKATAWFEVSDYNAGFAEGVQFLPGSNSVMRIAKIRVAHPGPVALLLGAYEPNVWQIETAPGTTIVGVWASGYHAQRVTGVPGTTPVVLSSYEGKGSCGNAYRGIAQAYGAQLNTGAVRTVSISKGIAYVGEQAPSYKPFAGALLPSEFAAKDDLLPHSHGLVQLMDRGVLKPASSEERAKLPAWMQADRGRAYLVLKPTVLPRGMYGANGAGTVFIVPPGVPEPTGDLGHTRLYNLTTKTCRTGSGECQ